MKKLTILFALVIMVFSCDNDDSITPVLEPRVVAEFKPNLSELNLFTGNLDELVISPYAFEYKLNTPLFSDYASKQRLISLPEGTSLEYDGDGLPIFPNNTVIAKTFYYNNDDRDLDRGRRIIETRILIKINGDWETGDYKWNDEQTDANLDLNGSTVPVTWIDNNGISNSINYLIPSDAQCATCHTSYNNKTPIGPKLRNLNFNINGVNQLQQFIDNQKLDGLTNTSEVSSVPNWKDTSASIESRARAYMDINCAYCHKAGGYCEIQSGLRIGYETLLEDSNIIESKNSISFRIATYNPGISMPFIGTNILHTEGVAVIQAYLDTL